MQAKLQLDDLAVLLVEQGLQAPDSGFIPDFLQPSQQAVQRSRLGGFVLPWAPDAKDPLPTERAKREVDRPLIRGHPVIENDLRRRATLMAKSFFDESHEVLRPLVRIQPAEFE